MEMPDATKRSQAMSVEEALAQMQAAVRRAEMQQVSTRSDRLYLTIPFNCFLAHIVWNLMPDISCLWYLWKLTHRCLWLGPGSGHRQ
jgi:hypothetical protein